jgi:hypothetical protein
LASVPADRILHFNRTGQPILKEIALRAEDFGEGTGRPATLKVHLDLPAHGIAAIRLGSP